MNDNIWAKLTALHAKCRKSAPALYAKANSEGTLYIYEPIGEDMFGGISAKHVADALNDMQDVRKLTVYVNSPGGAYFDGKAIYNQLRRFAEKREVVAVVDGLAASAATIVLMGASRVVMNASATMMIHEVAAVAAGNASTLRDMADVLEIETKTLAAIYAQRTGLDEVKVSAMLAAETFMTAAEAMELGFADELDGEEKPAPAKVVAVAPMQKAVAAAEQTRRVLSDAQIKVALAKLRMRTR